MQDTLRPADVGFAESMCISMLCFGLNFSFTRNQPQVLLNNSVFYLFSIVIISNLGLACWNPSVVNALWNEAWIRTFLSADLILSKKFPILYKLSFKSKGTTSE